MLYRQKYFLLITLQSNIETLAAAKGMYNPHRYFKSPFLRNKKSEEEVQLLPEIGLARKHTRNMGDDVPTVNNFFPLIMCLKNPEQSVIT